MIRVPLRSLATLVLAVFVSTCSDAPTGAPTPAKSTGPARIALAATFSKSAAAVFAQRNEFADITFDHVRVILRHASDQSIVKDTTIAFSPSSPDLTLDFTIEGANPGDSFPVELQFLSGAAPIFQGTGNAQAYAPEGTPPTPTPIVVVYVGPGANATRLLVAPKTISLVAPSSTPFTVAAFDASSAPVTSVPINWTTSDPTVATISSAGVLATTGKRGTVTVTATSVTGLTDNATVNVSLPPATITLVSGGGQSGKVGTTLSLPALVRVTASDGIGVAGVNVNFSPPSGGKVGSTSVITDAAGQASTTLTLGTTVGSQGFAATTAGLSVGISANATPGDAIALVVVSGGGQIDSIKKTLKNPFVVKVTDSFGNPVPGVTVAWARGSGSGSLSASSTVSGADGSTSVSYTLGTTVGTETIVATIPGGASATFIAQAISAGPSAIALVSGNNQIGRVGEALPAAFVVKVTDVSGNGIGGIAVSWTATNGTIAATTTTDDGGNSSNTMTLGTTLGTASATASVGTGTSAKSVSFAATVAAGVVSKALIGTFPSGGTAGVVLSPLTVELLDASGNLTNAANAVTVAIGTNPGGATLGGTLTRNAVAGVATFSDLTLSAAGTGYTLVASSTGVPSVTTPPFSIIAGGGLTRTWNGSVSADWNVAGNWTGGGVPTTANSVTIPSETPHQPVLTAGGFVRDLTVSSGASLNLSLFTLTATNSVDGGTGPGITGGAVLLANTSTLRGVVSNVSVTANTVTLSGPTTVTGSISLFGGGAAPAALVIGQPLTVSGALAVSGTSVTTSATVNVITGATATVGSLSMSGASAVFSQTGGTLTVSGLAEFAGNSTAGKITGGTLVIDGSFVETGTSATDDFAASGTHTTVFNGSSVQSLTFATSTSSHFQNLSFAGVGAITVTGGALQINGQLISPTGPSTVNAGGRTINAAGLDVDGLTINNGAIVSTGGTITRFDNVTFSGYLASATPLTITHPGASTPFTFSNDQFLVTPTSGHYMNVTDSNPSDGNALSITMLNSTPADGSSQTVTAGGALVNWSTSGATIAWTSATSGSWSNSANWNLGRVPSLGDSVVIALSGTYTVTLDTTYLAKSIVIGGPSGVQTLAISNRTLTVSNFLTTLPNGVFSPTSSTVIGPGTVTNQGTLNLGSSVIAAPISFVNNGTLLVAGNSAINGALATVAGSFIRLQGNPTFGTSSLTVPNSFTNNATIELTSISSGYSAQLVMPAGTLTNAVGGSISSLVGAAGGRTITAALNNQGAIVVDQALTINQSSAVHTNAGVINVSGGTLTVNQSGTSPSFTNTGTLAVSPGQTFAVTNGAFTQQTGATLNGGGAFTMTGGTATFNTAFSLSAMTLASLTANFATALSTSALALTFTNSTINGAATLTNTTGQTFTLQSSAFNLTSIVNQGTLLAVGTNTISSPLTTATGSLLQLQGNGSIGNSSLTIANGFTNNGVIDLASFGSSFSEQLTVTSGTLLNAAGATISATAGTGGTRTIAAQLNNQGTITVNQPLAINQSSAVHTNAGVINVSGGTLTINQSGTSPSFTNTGTLAVSPGQTFAVTNGTFTQQTGATLNGGGAFTMSGGTANFNTAFALSAMTLASLTANFATALSTSALALTFTNSTINGAAVLTNTTGQTFTLQSSAFNLSSIVNQGTLLAVGTNTISSPLTTASGSALELQGNGSVGNSSLTIANGFTNNGVIDLASVGSSFSEQLTVTSGTLLNAAGATISATAGTGGTRTISAQLNNQGTITVNQPLAINQSSAVHTNSGTINVSSGTLTINQSGTSPSFTNTGTLAVSPGQTFAVTNGAFTQQTGATLNGGGAFTMTGGTATFNTAFSLSAMTLASLTANFATALSTSALALTFTNSTINGAAVLTNTTGQTFTLQSSAFNLSSIVNQGTLLAVGTNTISSPLTTASGSALELQGNGSVGNSSLTIANGFTNNGVIDLASVGSSFSEQLTVTSGTLLNAAGATISATAGTGGTRTISAQLNNQGTITVNQPLAINQSNAVHTNSGTINVSSGTLTINQSGTSPSFTNTGTLAVSPGQTFAVTNGTFTQQTGATLNGGGAFSMTGGTASFNTAFALSAMTLTSLNGNFATALSTAGLALTFVNSTISGAAVLTNATGQTFTLQSVTLGVSSLINQGTLIATGNNLINSPLTTVVGSLLQAQGNSAVGNSTLSFANGFTNNGAIELVSTASSFSEQLTVNAGTLTNAPGATITSVAGTGGTRTLTAQVNNQGTITVNQPLVMNQGSVNYTNPGTINVSGGSLTVNQVGVSASFTNTGTISVAAGQTFAITNGTFTHQTGATLNGGGAFSMTGGTANFNSAFTLSAMTLQNLTADLAVDISTTGLSLAFAGSSIFGAANLTNVPTSTFTVQSSTVGLASIVNQGTIIAVGTSTINSPIIAASGSTLEIQGNGSIGNSNLTVSSGFINNGTIEMTSVGSSFSEQLTIASGTLTNAAGAIFRTLLGAGGTRTIVGNVDNQGSFRIAPGAAQTVALTGNFTNSGDVQLELGGTTVGSQYSRLAISGTATLSGGLIGVALNSGFTPTAGNTFNVLTYASKSGDFTTYSLPGTWTSSSAGTTAVTLIK